MSHLPRMISIGDVSAPEAPTDLPTTGVDVAFLSELALKAAYTTTQFSTEWAAQRLRLSTPLLAELLEALRKEQLLEALGASGPLGYRYTISHHGRKRAERLFEISGYVGPAPVSLESYRAMIEWQSAHNPEVTPENVASAISELVLPDEAAQLAGLAISSGRSLFISGPPGNGKTVLARLLHNALRGDMWIPHCLVVDNSIIRVFDQQCHELADFSAPQPWTIDQRWVRIRRPLIVVGGELTIDALDLSYSPGLRYYEAPMHIKSNGGNLLIDDFGRQRVDPHQLLNRWIIPLEFQIDYLTLHTGQKIVVPFRQMVIFATNLDPADVTDPAFLRRMGYRLYLVKPSPERYAEIFKRYAARSGAAADPSLIGRVLERYRSEGRELRGCEPRDLIERAKDICRFRSQPLELNDEVLDVAWNGYFGHTQPTG
ncbi:MAG: ATP-binding protein [Planctomycetaceae bacterium]|nr:ATP-binding protein [Planctomycetaceae bacterium]